MRGQCLSWVKSVVLTLRRLLPVCPMSGHRQTTPAGPADADLMIVARGSDKEDKAAA